MILSLINVIRCISVSVRALPEKQIQEKEGGGTLISCKTYVPGQV